MINFVSPKKKKSNKTKEISQIKLPDHPYGRLIIGSSGSNSLFNIINHQRFLLVTDAYEPNYQLLITNVHEHVCII